jgi:hypothetical protein
MKYGESRMPDPDFDYDEQPWGVDPDFDWDEQQ